MSAKDRFAEFAFIRGIRGLINESFDRELR